MEKEVPKVQARKHTLRPRGYETIYILSNPMLNLKTNYYESVRFSHRSHDCFTGGNCSICHYRTSYDEEDRIGVSISELHKDMDINLGAPCTSCHGDMKDIVLEACDKCHLGSFQLAKGTLGRKSILRKTLFFKIWVF